MPVPLIGQNATTSEDPEFASLSEEDKERLAQMAEEHPEDTDASNPVSFAFVVFMDKGGEVGVDLDVSGTPYAPDRTATGSDIFAACSLAVSDLQASKAAQLATMQMAQMGQMMAQKQQEAAIRAQMAANQAKGFGGR